MLTRTAWSEADVPAKVNAYLRRLFVRVVVDMSEPGKKGPSRSVPAMSFEWRDPSMRADDETMSEDEAAGAP